MNQLRHDYAADARRLRRDSAKSGQMVWCILGLLAAGIVALSITLGTLHYSAKRTSSALTSTQIAAAVQLCLSRGKLPVVSHFDEWVGCRPPGPRLEIVAKHPDSKVETLQ